MAGLGPLLERWRLAPPKPHYCYVHSPTTLDSMDPLRFTTVVATLLQQLRPPEYSTLVAPPQYFIIPLVLHHKWRRRTI